LLSRTCHIPVIIAGILFFAACTAQRAPDPVKLTIFGFSLNAGNQLRQDALEDFTRKTGVAVDLIPTPGTSEEQMTLIADLLGRGAKTPDIYLIDVIWPGTLHEHLLDLTPYLDEGSRRHIPALLANDTIENRVVSLPFYLNAGMLYYRTDLLKKYGYEAPPDTWEQLARMALRIQKGERSEGKRAFWGYIWQGAPYEGLTCNALEWQASFGGGRIIETDGSVSVNNAYSVKAMESAKAWVGSISPDSVLAYTESDTLNVFRSGNAAFMRHWSSAFRGIAERSQPKTVGIALLPAGPSGRAQSVGGFHLAVSRYSAHPRQAAELVLFLTGMEIQARRALRRGFIPT